MKHTEPRSVNPSVFLLFLAALALSSCGKEENNTPTPSEDMSAMVDMGEGEDMPRTCEGAGCEEMDVPSTCGDGNLDEGEACDDGNKDDGDYCAADCSRETGACGDGTKQDNEACDDGMNPDGACPYGEMSCMVCDANCQLTDGATSFCGDGVVQQDEGELCDDGDDNADDAECLPDCTRPFPIKLATHSLNTYALMSNGTVYGWGDNSAGQLASKTVESSFSPVLIEGLKDVTDVVSNSGTACALDQDKAVYCWGFGSAGSLGNGSFEDSYIPTKLEILPTIEKIAAGGTSMCALTSTGEVHCWGGNNDEQLGFVGEKQSTPVKINLPEMVTFLEQGTDHACAILSTSHVWCWGDGLGYAGPTGSAPGLPSEVPELAGATALFAGEARTFFLREGEFFGIGFNGRNARMNLCCEEYYSEAIKIPDLVDVTYANAGDQHGCAIVQDGSLFCWGAPDDGQLSQEETFFTQVMGIEGTLDVAAGRKHTCAIDGQNRVFCWGDNEYSQLGLDGEGGPTPREVIFWP